MKRFLLLSICLVLLGCATASNLKNISIGMPKKEVIQIMGEPKSVSANGNVEYLQYTNIRPFATPTDWSSDYFVRLVDGKVESYGKVGDFDSTKNPTNDINLNLKS